MHYIEFVASEPITGDIELDLDGVDTKEEAKEIAVKAIEQMFPNYDNIQVILMKEIE